MGVPMVLVLDAETGFLISKKGRTDICDLGIGCMKNWADEKPDMEATVSHLIEGKAKVDARKKAEEEAEAKRRKEEKDA